MRTRDVAILALGALAVRVAYNLAFLDGYLPRSDADHYHGIATNIAAGEGFVHPFPFADAVPQATAFRPPLYPYLLGAAYWLFGSDLVVAQALNVVLGTGVVVLVALVAQACAGPRAALVAGGVAAVLPPLVANDGPPLSEPLGLALQLGAVLALGAARTTWAGLATGLLVLTRPSAQALAAVLAVWVAWRLGARRALGFAAVVALVVSPWLVRNWVELGSPVLVTSNGYNLAALYAEAAGEDGRWVDPLRDDRLADIRRGATDEVELEERFRDEALRSIGDDPSQIVTASVRNLLRLAELLPFEQEPAERSDGRNLSLRYATLAPVWAVMVVGAVGLWSVRRHRFGGLLILVALASLVVTLPFSPGAPRLRAPVDVALCIGVGAAWAAHHGRRGERGAAGHAKMAVHRGGEVP